MLNSPFLWITLAFSASYLAFALSTNPLELAAFAVLAVVCWIRFVASAIAFLRASPWK